jgi:hypothetical protein
MAVTPADIAVELGRTAPGSFDAEYAQWELWIADALYLIGKRLTIADLDPGDVDYVVRHAVAAHVKRPDDATQVAVAVDDGSMSRTYRSSKGRVEIIDEWWALLSPPDSNGRAFSIRPTTSGGPHQPWCALLMGASYCSCGADLTNYTYPLYELSGDEY